MSYLAIAKRVLAEIAERENLASERTKLGVSSKNATNPEGSACRPEVLEMKGALIEMFNERAAILEYEAGFPRSEAERRAKIETESTETFRRLQALEADDVAFHQ